ncbi:MAG: dienelactone hydrolase family protein [Chitinivibrionales bacterium]|nr:dienelactone hydrolase family protein [Chitinivibrionales bacterium]
MNDQKINSPRIYENNAMNRHEFLKKSMKLAGATAAGVLLSPYIHSHGEIIAPNDSRLTAEMIQYPGKTGDIRAYCAALKEVKKRPALIVIHENRGLQPHIKDVARRLALEGFFTIAPDALSTAGGTPDDEEKAQSMIKALDTQSTIANFVAAVQYLKTHPQSTGKIGCVGFCWGGAMANNLAVNSPDLKAVVPYYGSQPDAADVRKIKAAMLLHYAENDERINKGIPPFEEALKKAGVEYSLYIYKSAQHAFNNDTNPQRYHKESAELAWKRTIDFFNRTLKE